MSQAKRLNSQEKVAILRELLENDIQIGELSEKYNLHPNAIYNWKKKLFEEASTLFEAKKERINVTAEAKIKQLETKLKDKDSLISEIVEDNIRLQKKLNGDY